MNWRRDARGEYTLDAAGRRVAIVTFDEFERMKANNEAAAKHNRRVRELSKNKKGKPSGNKTEESIRVHRT